VFVSTDDGQTWEPAGSGLAVPDVYSLNAVRAGDELRLYAGTEPAHLFTSTDLGRRWQELPRLRAVSSVDEWNFPAPPHHAHVKNINFDPRSPDVIYASVEQGVGLKSVDAGKTWREMPCYTAATHGRVTDVHRVVVDPFDPDSLFITSGDGLFHSEDAGATWTQYMGLPPRIAYADVLLFHPRRQGCLFLAGANTNPSEWRRTKTADSALCRSQDAGKTWEVLQRGLPAHIHGNVAAMSMNIWPAGFSLFVATTDGDVFYSDDEGDTWTTVVSGIAAISKAGHYRMLATA
jgi:photosystem II stability/assembly factor-like uncharacterized protein